MSFVTKPTYHPYRLKKSIDTSQVNAESPETLVIDDLVGISVHRLPSTSSLRLYFKNEHQSPIYIISNRSFKTTSSYGEEVSDEFLGSNAIASKRLFGTFDEGESMEFTLDVMTHQIDKLFRRYEGSITRFGSYIYLNCTVEHYNELVNV